LTCVSSIRWLGQWAGYAVPQVVMYSAETQMQDVLRSGPG